MKRPLPSFRWPDEQLARAVQLRDRMALELPVAEEKLANYQAEVDRQRELGSNVSDSRPFPSRSTSSSPCAIRCRRWSTDARSGGQGGRERGARALRCRAWSAAPSTRKSAGSGRARSAPAIDRRRRWSTSGRAGAHTSTRRTRRVRWASRAAKPTAGGARSRPSSSPTSSGAAWGGLLSRPRAADKGSVPTGPGRPLPPRTPQAAPGCSRGS